MVTLLLMLLTSCVSSRGEKEVIVPELDFPVFPVLDGYERNEEEEKVTVSEDWIIRLAEFQIHYEETAKNYEAIKALYEKIDKE